MLVKQECYSGDIGNVLTSLVANPNRVHCRHHLYHTNFTHHKPLVPLKQQHSTEGHKNDTKTKAHLTPKHVPYSFNFIYSAEAVYISA